MKFTALLCLVALPALLTAQELFESKINLDIDGMRGVYPLEINESEFYIVYEDINKKSSDYKIEYVSGLKVVKSAAFVIPHEVKGNNSRTLLDNKFVLDNRVILLKPEHGDDSYTLNYSVVNKDLVLETENKNLISEAIPKGYDTYGYVDISVSKNKEYFSVVYIKPHPEKKNTQIEFVVQVFNNKIEKISENSFMFQENKEFFSYLNQFVLNDDGSFFIKIDDFEKNEKEKEKDSDMPVSAYSNYFPQINGVRFKFKTRILYNFGENIKEIDVKEQLDVNLYDLSLIKNDKDKLIFTSCTKTSSVAANSIVKSIVLNKQAETVKVISENDQEIPALADQRMDLLSRVQGSDGSVISVFENSSEGTKVSSSGSGADRTTTYTPYWVKNGIVAVKTDLNGKITWLEEVKKSQLLYNGTGLISAVVSNQDADVVLYYLDSPENFENENPEKYNIPLSLKMKPKDPVAFIEVRIDKKTGGQSNKMQLLTKDIELMPCTVNYFDCNGKALFSLFSGLRSGSFGVLKD